jgi:V8-like Glu-specific endopeptidase
MVSTGGLSPVAYAQEDEQAATEDAGTDDGGAQSNAEEAKEEPQAAEEQDADAANDAESAGEAEDANDAAAETARQEDAAEDGGDQDAGTDVDETESADEAADSDDSGDSPAVDEGPPAPAVFMTEEWASPVVEDESDDAIPTDKSLDPTGQPWVVVAPDVSKVTGGPDWARIQRHRRGDYAGKSEIPIVQGPAKGKAPGPPGKDTPYSFGGKPVAPGSTPWQAQLYASTYQSKTGEPTWRAQHKCGGALIASDWVVTAAHCLDEMKKPLGWRVRVGSKDLARGDDGVSYAVDRWVVHSGYQNRPVPNPPPNMYANDIALLHIKADAQTRRPADGKPITPIVVYSGPVAKSAEVTAIGWGMTEQTAHSFSAVALKVDLQVMDNDLCRSRPGYGPERINATVMCAARPKQKTCKGDSGGPVILTNRPTPELVGLVSWGKDQCTGDGEPSVFTRLQSHFDWIKKAMQLDPSVSTL